MRLDISRTLVLALGLTTALAATTACGDDTGGVGGGGGAGGSAAETTSTGGTPDCTTLCATYGAAVPAVVDQIVTDSLADPRFSDDFAGLAAAGDARVTEFKANLSAFISDAYGCTTNTYAGADMVTAHEGLVITQDDYTAFVNLCAGALIKKGVPEDYVGACFAPGLTGAELTDSIVNSP